MTDPDRNSPDTDENAKPGIARPEQVPADPDSGAGYGNHGDEKDPAQGDNLS